MAEAEEKENKAHTPLILPSPSADFSPEPKAQFKLELATISPADKPWKKKLNFNT